MSWWHSYRSVSRDELMAGALTLADRGCPVAPGTFWQGRRWAGMPDAPRSGSVPILADGLVGATCDRGAIVEWWSELPYTVLLPTGSALDAIEVSPPVGRRLSAYLHESGVIAPAGTTPTGRWWFLVGAGEPLRPELATRSDVTLRGRGSWVVAPPSQDARGLVQWRVQPPAPDPGRAAVSLPDTYDVQLALLDVLGQRSMVTAAAPAVGAGRAHRWP